VRENYERLRDRFLVEGISGVESDVGFQRLLQFGWLGLCGGDPIEWVISLHAAKGPRWSPREPHEQNRLREVFRLLVNPWKVGPRKTDHQGDILEQRSFGVLPGSTKGRHSGSRGARRWEGRFGAPDF
jgi:hypothetical protein